MNRFCVHHNDFDGEAAAAIVNKYYNGEITCFSINYNNNFPFDLIEKDDEVWIVDFSLQKDGDWQKLLDITQNVIWIDHHKTAIESAEENGIENLKGTRTSAEAGCVLTWQFCFPNTNLPTIVALIGDYDIWRFEFGEQTKQLNKGLMALIDTRPKSDFWNDTLISADLEIRKLAHANEIVHDICKSGEKIMAKQKILDSQLVQDWGFEVEFEGYKTIALNRNHVGSQFFESVAKNYDILMPFIFDGMQYTVSLYAEESSGIDVGELAKQYGGGGHKGASGFQCKELPFKFIKRLQDA